MADITRYHLRTAEVPCAGLRPWWDAENHRRVTRSADSAAGRRSARWGWVRQHAARGMSIRTKSA